MSSMGASVIGFNSPRCFVAFEEKVFIPAGNGVVVTEDGESTFWQPTSGLYAIQNIAVSCAGILCLAERRLDVGLLLYDATTLRRLDEAPRVATAQVSELVFSDSGRMLFVLCSMPQCCVEVLKVANGKRLEAMQTIRCASPHNGCVLPVSFVRGGDDFVVVSERGLVGYALDAAKGMYVEYLSVEDVGFAITSAAPMVAGVLLGATDGCVHRCDFLTGKTEVVLTFPGEGAVTAMRRCEEHLLLGTETGEVRRLLCPTLEVGARCRADGCVQGIAYGGEGATAFVGTEEGIFLLSVVDDRASLVAVKQRTREVVRCIHMKEGTFAAVCRDGSYVLVSRGETSTLHRSAEQVRVMDACLLEGCCLVFVCEDDTVRGVDAQTGVLLWCAPLHLTGSLMCASDGKNRVVCSGVSSLSVLQVMEEGRPVAAVVQARTAARIAGLHWIPGDDIFLAAYKNGEVHLMRFPPLEEGEDTEDTKIVMPEGIWRLDFPFCAMFPCYVESDTINLLVHSLDKDTKLYALDRRREVDGGKVLRPLFLMRDHESGGSGFVRYNEDTVLSTGKDGRVVLREIGHYQAKIPTIPPSKEKRKPVFERVARHFFNGGITTACVLGDLVVCGGADSVLTVLCVFTDRAWRWPEVPWEVIDPDVSSRTLCELEGGTEDQWVQERKALVEQMAELREEWSTVLSNSEVDVPVEAMLLPGERAEFRAKCQQAVDEMRVNEHYHSLLNDYVQDVITKKYWNSMEVQLEKLVSIGKDRVETFNFPILKTTKARQQVARKAAFLRRVQKRVASGYAFAGLREVSAEQPDSDKGEGEEVEDSASPWLYSSFDVYTRGRVALQSLMLKGMVLSLKERFNEKFNELRGHKRYAVALIEERNTRCLKLTKQLNESVGELYCVRVERSEDPESVFKVSDEELDEDVRGLAVKDTVVGVVSPSNEAALKLWMDGLEKEVEVLRVTLKPPEFADENLEAYVPPDERTEEQARRMEDYEKQLAEETDVVNTKRQALRNEFASLQKENGLTAGKVDREILELRWLRLSTAEKIDEIELQLVKLLQHTLRMPEAAREYTKMSAEAEELRRALRYKEALLKDKESAADDALRQLQELEEDSAGYVLSVRGKMPFSDGERGERLHRRFGRWKRRFDGGKAELPGPTASDDTPLDLWEMYCGHCEQVSALDAECAAMRSQHEACAEALACVRDERSMLCVSIGAVEKKMRDLQASLIGSLLDTETLLHVRQGQIQEERAVMASDYSSTCIRWAEDVSRYNALILQSSAENLQLLEGIVSRRKNMKMLAWDAERLRYSMGTLQMELRQFHTMHVTKQMREWLMGGCSVSEEENIKMIERNMQFVSENMKKKLQSLGAVSAKLKNKITERVMENSIVQTQVSDLRSIVEDRTAVKSMVDGHGDGSRYHAQRAREIFRASELEELARSQQEELLRLKGEVDRLRERTFPSFAVVSRRTT